MAHFSRKREAGIEIRSISVAERKDFACKIYPFGRNKSFRDETPLREDKRTNFIRAQPMFHRVERDFIENYGTLWYYNLKR